MALIISVLSILSKMIGPALSNLCACMIIFMALVLAIGVCYSFLNHVYKIFFCRTLK